MERKYVIFIGIIFGAFIIGGFFYMAITNKTILPQNNFFAINTQNKSSTTQTATCGAKDNAVVTKIIDGDTIVVEGGYHVRLLGIDADEKNYPCYESAKNRLEELVLNKTVVLEKDITDVDQYGRCLRTIFNGTQNIDLQLIKEGLAVARFYSPNIKYKDEISVAEKQAIENKIGCKWR